MHDHQQANTARGDDGVSRVENTMHDHQQANTHHLAAAYHHTQAMQLHHSASRHYAIGKDYAHAALQALTAHGHAVMALAQSDAAVALQGGESEVEPALPGLEFLTPCCATHHDAAANHHKRAAKQNTLAVSLHQTGDPVRALRASALAREHACQAMQLSNRAAVLHAQAGDQIAGDPL